MELSARERGMTIEWQEERVDEKGINPATGKAIVAVAPRYFRPVTERAELCSFWVFIRKSV